ncbi:MAG: hypothetical protein ACK40X_05210 [Armatimonadota bacterium]
MDDAPIMRLMMLSLTDMLDSRTTALLEQYDLSSRSGRGTSCNLIPPCAILKHAAI